MTNNIIFKLKDGGITEVSPIDKVFYANEKKEKDLDKKYTHIKMTDREIIIAVPIEVVEKQILDHALAVNAMTQETFIAWTKQW